MKLKYFLFIIFIKLFSFKCLCFTKKQELKTANESDQIREAFKKKDFIALNKLINSRNVNDDLRNPLIMLFFTDFQKDNDTKILMLKFLLEIGADPNKKFEHTWEHRNTAFKNFMYGLYSFGSTMLTDLKMLEIFINHKANFFENVNFLNKFLERTLFNASCSNDKNSCINKHEMILVKKIITRVLEADNRININDLIEFMRNTMNHFENNNQLLLKNNCLEILDIIQRIHKNNEEAKVKKIQELKTYFPNEMIRIIEQY